MGKIRLEEVWPGNKWVFMKSFKDKKPELEGTVLSLHQGTSERTRPQKNALHTIPPGPESPSGDQALT